MLYFYKVCYIARGRAKGKPVSLSTAVFLPHASSRQLSTLMVQWWSTPVIGRGTSQGEKKKHEDETGQHQAAQGGGDKGGVHVPFIIPRLIGLCWRGQEWEKRQGTKTQRCQLLWQQHKRQAAGGKTRSHPPGFWAKLTLWSLNSSLWRFQPLSIHYGLGSFNPARDLLPQRYRFTLGY